MKHKFNLVLWLSLVAPQVLYCTSDNNPIIQEEESQKAEDIGVEESVSEPHSAKPGENRVPQVNVETSPSGSQPQQEALIVNPARVLIRNKERAESMTIDRGKDNPTKNPLTINEGKELPRRANTEAAQVKRTAQEEARNASQRARQAVEHVKEAVRKIRERDDQSIEYIRNLKFVHG